MKKVLLLLSEGFEFFEASVFIDVFGWNLVEGDGSTKLFSCGVSKTVTSSFNQLITVDHTIDEISCYHFDALAIPGGFEEFGFYTCAYSDKFLNVIKEFNKQGKPIASICTGSLPIAQSGALLNRRGTTYNLNPRRQQSLKELNVIVEQKPIVIDKNIITSWNPSTALDVAFLLLEILTSKQQSNKIKKLMGFL